MVRSDDPGLQVERTTLAWTRTTLSFAVASLLLIRAGRPETLVVAVLLALIGLMSSVALGLLQRRRHRDRVHDFNRSIPVHGPRQVLVGAVLTVILALAALWCVWS